MGRLIDETELEKYIIHDGCEKGCGYIDERDLKYIPTAEAIPKADVMAILEEIRLKINKISYEEMNVELVEVDDVNNIIQEKINKLKENI